MQYKTFRGLVRWQNAAKKKGAKIKLVSKSVRSNYFHAVLDGHIIGHFYSNRINVRESAGQLMNNPEREIRKHREIAAQHARKYLRNHSASPAHSKYLSK